jgi:alcohol dehydrogenase (cytochrome c)
VRIGLFRHIIALGLLLPAWGLALPIGVAAQAGGDWPIYGGSYANTRRSELTQVNSSNVRQLRLAWKFSTGEYGQFESSPIIVGDTLYFTTGRTGSVIALDATTGRLKWRYTPRIAPAPFIMQVNRGVAVAAGRVFVATLDAHLIALNAANGQVLWDTRIGNSSEGLTETMAPLAWRDLVFIGSSGGEYGIRGSFSAYAQNDGHLVWRWWTVSPGWEGKFVASVNGYSLHRDLRRERADAPKYRDTWKHGGGPVWMTPALDPSEATIYLSTGNPAPNYNDQLRPGDNLYTDSIVALDARTGRMKWYYQETPHDRWDYDAASPPVLFDVKDRFGRSVPAVGEAGKTGWFYIVERRTGRLIRLATFIPQTRLYQPPTPQGQIVQPGEGGGAIAPVAYDPALRSVFVAGTVVHELVRQDPAKPWPDSGTEWQLGDQTWIDHGSALISRIDVDHGSIVWQYHVPDPVVGGLLSAADLVFFGEEGTGAFDALDAKTGELLWQSKPTEVTTSENWLQVGLHILANLVAIAGRLWNRIVSPHSLPPSDQDIHAPPVAYERGGREYIVVASDLYYSTRDVNGGDTLYAFTLPSPAR